MGGKELWKEIIIVILVIVEILKLILEIINKITKNKMKKILEQIVEILVETNKVVNFDLAIVKLLVLYDYSADKSSGNTRLFLYVQHP